MSWNFKDYEFQYFHKQKQNVLLKYSDIFDASFYF